jgi:hypothetical protein
MRERLEESSGNMYQKVQKLKEIASQVDLGKKLNKIFDEIEKLCQEKIDTLHKRNFEIEDPQVIEAEHWVNDETSEMEISFGLKGKCYCLRKSEKIHMDSHFLPTGGTCTTTLKYNSGEKLFEVSTYLFSNYSCDIKCFFPGEWIKDFLILYERILYYERKNDLEQQYAADEVNSLRKNFLID